MSTRALSQQPHLRHRHSSRAVSCFTSSKLNFLHKMEGAARRQRRCSSRLPGSVQRFSLARPASAKNRLARRGMKIILRQRNFVFHIPPFNTQPPLFPEFFPFLPFFFSHPKPVDNLKVPLSLIFV